MRVLGTLVLGILLAGFSDGAGAPQAAGQKPASAPQAAAPDSSRRSPAVSPGSIRTVSDSTTAQKAEPAVRTAPKDSALATRAVSKSRSDTVLVVKHSFNHRQQIITGSVIMTCLMLMMVTMNNYNPR